MSKIKLFLSILLIFIIIVTVNANPLRDPFDEVNPETSCPRCAHGNFKNHYSVLDDPFYFTDWQRKGYWENVDCETPGIEPCSAACLAIIFNKRGDDGIEYPYEGSIMTCASDVQVDTDWPAYLEKPKGFVNESFTFFRMHDDLQVTYIYHKVPYSNDFFENFESYGLPTFLPTLEPSNVSSPLTGLFSRALIIMFIFFVVMMGMRTVILADVAMFKTWKTDEGKQNEKTEQTAKKGNEVDVMEQNKKTNKGENETSFRKDTVSPTDNDFEKTNRIPEIRNGFLSAPLAQAEQVDGTTPFRSIYGTFS